MTPMRARFCSSDMAQVTAGSCLKRGAIVKMAMAIQMSAKVT